VPPPFAHFRLPALALTPRSMALHHPRLLRATVWTGLRPQAYPLADCVDVELYLWAHGVHLCQPSVHNLIDPQPTLVPGRISPVRLITVPTRSPSNFNVPGGGQRESRFHSVPLFPLSANYMYSPALNVDPSAPATPMPPQNNACVSFATMRIRDFRCAQCGTFGGSLRTTIWQVTPLPG